MREESNVYGKVDIIITDRPLNMSAVYDKYYGGSGLLTSTADRVRELQIEEGLRHLDLFVKRSKPYQVVGRFENEEQAHTVDQITQQMFDLIPVSTVEDVIEQLNVFQTPKPKTFVSDRLDGWCRCSDGYTRKVDDAVSLGFVKTLNPSEPAFLKKTFDQQT